MRSLGYSTRTTQYSSDYGVDVFAEKGEERLAVQAKVFGSTAREINREMVMRLYGAKDYFDCTRAVIAADGVVIENALEVARKLGVEVIYIEPHRFASPVSPLPGSSDVSFDKIWESYAMPLQGQTLHRENGETNEIVTVDWGGVERITSNGNRRGIQIEIFRKTINHILEHGSITRIQINEEYARRASSGIVLILAQVPIFELTTGPQGLRLKRGIK